ncbi:dTMP kinase [Actinocorallia populi]|uniref:dTMP kinase n=1 Tax=Actinocorallia populi TaxID=2079200 RepID=UPI000D0950A6|nr:dTMP kinase [Actinocorallia populi]
MTKLRPFSEQRRGLFVSVDGPSGTGKSTIVAHLAELFTADGEDVHTTAEPSGSRIGVLARELTETVTGPALACLYSADRYHHLDQEIRPRLESGQLVICDRYVPSGLVMQRFDGLDPAFLWGLNSHADRPDLAVILEAHPQTIAERLAVRGAHNRFQLTPGSSHAETHFYRQACDRLIRAGYDVLPIDCTDKPAEELAATIRDRLRAFFAVPDQETVR